MLQVNVLRQNPEWVKERLAIKNFTQLHLVDEIITLDDRRKSLQLQLDTAQSKINAASKSIGKLIAQGKKEEAEAAKKEVAELRPALEPLKAEMTQVENELQDKIVLLPNLPNEKVKPGKSDADNEVVKTGGQMKKLPENALPHWDIIRKLDIVDFELGAKITGSGFAVYKGQGAKLQRALSSYFLDFNTAAGYTEYIPPYMVNEASAFGTGQLPDKEAQMYTATADNLYLIPTAEVPVTNVYRDTILKESELPIKMTAYSHCFRREAGSFGKDVRGLNRVHEFEKVEIIQFSHPDKSYEALQEMLDHVEKLVNSLELPYHILRLCGGDLSFTSAITYDFEVYSEAQGKWLEVSSVSNFETYQANRLKTRFKNEEGKTQLVHTLNGSSLALPRILAAILENGQQEDGSIQLPKVLIPYFGAEYLK